MENPMQLSLVLMPEDGADVHMDHGLSSPMGGKHQRDLSLSAKWANNKALALEYLKRQREALLWIESVLERQLQTRDLHEELKSGIVLREVMAKLYPAPAGPSECRSPISRRYSLRMAPWKERENITIFLKQCKALGMNDTFLFCTDDLYEGTNMVQVLFSVQHFMAMSQEQSSHLFKPIVHENITFSNQEVEMALSKIEMAGVEANALLTSAPPSASPSPAKSFAEADEPSNDDDPSTASSEEESEPHTEDKQELEPAAGAFATSDEDQAAEALLEMEMEMLQDEAECNNKTEESGEDAASPAIEMSEEDFENLVHEQPTTEDADVVACEEVDITMECTAADNEDLADAQIILGEIFDDILTQIELEALGVGAQLTEVFIAEAGQRDVERHDSAHLSEMTDKQDTYHGDSLAPTVIDAPAEATGGADAKAASRAARASKKASKAVAKKAPASSNEELDVEAMSKCTCGSKCTIM